jgi:hypothetical protein
LDIELSFSINNSQRFILSRYIAITFVLSSSYSSCSISVSSISDLFHNEKNEENHRFFPDRISVMATAMAHDCEIIPIFQRSKKLPQKLKFNFLFVSQ